MNSRTLTRNVLGAAVMLAALTACDSDSTGPRTLSARQETADVAVVVGDGVSEDVGLFFEGDMSLSVAGGASAPRVAAAGASDWYTRGDCTYSPSTGRFTCPTITRNGLTFTRSFALYDASTPPQSQSAYDASTTASANFVFGLAGTVERNGWTAAINRNRDVTVSGLVGAETRRTWNGNGSASVNSNYSDDLGTRSYVMNSTTLAKDVVVAIPRAENRWPLSGTIEHNVSATRTREGAQTVSHSLSRSAKVTFNGTNLVTLQVGDRLFTLDLATGRITPQS